MTKEEREEFVSRITERTQSTVGYKEAKDKKSFETGVSVALHLALEMKVTNQHFQIKTLEEQLREKSMKLEEIKNHIHQLRMFANEGHLH